MKDCSRDLVLSILPSLLSFVHSWASLFELWTKHFVPSAKSTHRESTQQCNQHVRCRKEKKKNSIHSPYLTSWKVREQQRGNHLVTYWPELSWTRCATGWWAWLTANRTEHLLVTELDAWIVTEVGVPWWRVTSESQVCVKSLNTLTPLASSLISSAPCTACTGLFTISQS